jgi:hypothetical protein
MCGLQYGLWYSLFPVFICKEFFVFTQLTWHQHEANLWRCILCALVIEFIYLLIKYSVNLANIGFTYIRW